VFAIDPATKDNYASGSPTKSQAVYDRFVELDAAGKAHGAALAALASNPIASDSIEPVPVVCASCGFPWGMDPVRHAEMCDNRQALATPEGEKP
jgi:hypothetical protein